MSEIKTNLPQVRVTDPQLQKMLDSLALVLKTWNGETGNDLDRVLTYRDLVEDTVLATQLNNELASGQSGGIDFDGETDLTTPVQLSNLTAAAGLANIILSWDGSSQGNYAYTEIWRHSLDNLANATLLGTSIAGVYADSVGATSQTYYYWVRAVSTGATAGAFNATAGVSASTDPVQEGNFAATIEPVRIVSTLPTPSGYTGPNTVFLSTDNKLYRYDSSVPEWTTAVDSDDLITSSVIAGKIAAGAISTSSLFVDGVITAAKIQAGTITADRMTAGTITAASAILADAVITSAKIVDGAIITAKIKDAQITNAKIGTAAVDTLELAGQAVTIPVSTYTSGSIALTDTAWTTVQSATITSTGAPISILGSVVCINAPLFSGTSWFRFRILRGATDLTSAFSGILTVTGITDAVVISPILQDTPGSGSFTYHIQIYASTAATGDTTSTTRSLLLLETKR